jgi:hypothetical protein
LVCTKSAGHSNLYFMRLFIEPNVKCYRNNGPRSFHNTCFKALFYWKL